MKLFNHLSNHKVCLIAIITTLAIAACNQQPTQPPAVQISLNGAGASFPAPLYLRWFGEYRKLHPTQVINYQSVGSGAGIKLYIDKTVDFGATDQPLTDKERSKSLAANIAKPIQVPMTAGAMVLAYNLPGVKSLKLSRAAYCGIVLGEVKTWNDPLIVQDNQGVNLPDSAIFFIRRADSSGTTFIFTNHLKSACPRWQLGAGKSVKWQAGIASKGNEGVTAQVIQTVGAIGYTEYSYAQANKLTTAILQNKAGKFIPPSPAAACKAIASAPIPDDLVLLIPDPEDAAAYPIVGLTWLLIYEHYDQPAKAEAIKGMVKWALEDGKKYAEDLGYLPLPDQISTKVIALVNQIK